MQSLVQTNDKAIRMSFKDALAHKVEHSLAAPPPEPVKDSTISTLLVPSNYSELSSVDLHFSLLHNKELKHSRQTANLAVDIICGNTDKPANVELKVVELRNPVAIPVFDQKTEVKRSPARPLTAPDSKQARLAAEAVKQNEYQHYLANMFQRVDHPVEVREETLRVPSNWNDLTEQELFFTLTNQTELEHSRTSAYRAMDILSGKIVKPTGVTLQEVVLFRPVAQPRAAISEKEKIPAHVIETERGKREQAKANLNSKLFDVFSANPETIVSDSESILLLPTHYEELSEAGLFYTLTHNPDLKHSHDSATLTVGMIFGKVANPGVKFQTVDLAAPRQEIKGVRVPQDPDPLKGFIPERDIEKRAAHKEYLAGQTERVLRVKTESTAEEVILRLPNNYKELSQDALLETLIRNQGYKHTRDSAYLALDIMSGKLPKPSNVKFHAVTLPAPVVRPVVLSEDKKTEAAIHPDILANEEAKKSALQTTTTTTPVAKIEDFGLILRIPENFADLSQEELLYNLLNSTELAHDRKSAYTTIDILSGVVLKPANVTLQAVAPTKPEPVASQAPVKAVAVAALHPLQDEASTEKRNQHKEFLAEKARVAYNTKPVFKAQEERVILLPENYQSMNSGELHFALIRNPEFKHTNQQAVVTADMLAGKIGTPENVVFRTLQVENLQTATSLIKAAGTVKAPSPAKTEASLLPRARIPMGTEGKRVFLLPSGYAGMTEPQLHFALSHNREYGHSYESTYETIDIVFGRKACPDGTVFNTVLVDDPVERAY